VLVVGQHGIDGARAIQLDAAHRRYLYAMAMTWETWSCEEVCSVSRFLWVSCVFPIVIHCHLIEMYGYGLTLVKVRKMYHCA